MHYKIDAYCHHFSIPQYVNRTQIDKIFLANLIIYY